MVVMTADPPPRPLPPTAPDWDCEGREPVVRIEERAQGQSHVAPVGRDDGSHGHRHAVGDAANLRRVGHRTRPDDRDQTRDVVLDRLLKMVAAAPLNVVTLGAWRTFDRVSPWAAVRKR